jgi:hypothetical protein
MPSLGTLINDVMTRLNEAFPGNTAQVPFSLVWEHDEDRKAYVWAAYIEVRTSQTEFDIRSADPSEHRAVVTLASRLQAEITGR